MTPLVIDASVAIKWVVEEKESARALYLRRGHVLYAPDLIWAECANILWKKVARSEMTSEDARLAGRILLSSGIRTVPARQIVLPALDLAFHLRHPAYDCLYLAAASILQCACVTADRRLMEKAAASDEAIPAVLPLD